MVQIDKRQYIWRLNVLSDDISQRVGHFFGPNLVISIGDFLSIIGAMGFDRSSPVLADILRLAMTDDSTEIDVGLLFHVIGEAVQKIKDRNVLFWNTVMTITGASISWIDFRRKLSKWLSTNGMGVGHVKNVIYFVQQNVDRNSTGIVRKDAFLRFTDDLMGIDCLLSPEGLVALATQPVRTQLAYARPEQPAPVFYATPVSAPPFARQPVSSAPKQTLPVQIAFQQSAAPINDRVSVMEPVTPIQVPHDSSESRHSSQDRPENRESMYNIRVKLGVSSLGKALSSRMRMLFALYRIDAAARSRTPPPVVEVKAVRSTDNVKDSRPQRSAADCMLMAAVVRHLYQRTVGNAFSQLRLSGPASAASPADPDISLESIGDASGPSWTVTIQAVAVSNLFGILRTCVTRATMPAYFSLKTGHSVDVYNPLRKVLWAQSNQGKKDGLVAAAKIPKITLMPIRENGGSASEDKENVPLEFDLST